MQTLEDIVPPTAVRSSSLECGGGPQEEEDEEDDEEEGSGGTGNKSGQETAQVTFQEPLESKLNLNKLTNTNKQVTAFCLCYTFRQNNVKIDRF